MVVILKNDFNDFETRETHRHQVKTFKMYTFKLLCKGKHFAHHGKSKSDKCHHRTSSVILSSYAQTNINKTNAQAIPPRRYGLQLHLCRISAI